MAGNGAGEGTTGSSVWSLDISPSGDRIAIGSGYPELAVTKLHGKGIVEISTRFGGIPGTLCTGPDGTVYAGIVARMGLGNIVALSSKGQVLWQKNTQKKIESVRVSPDGEMIVAGSKDGTLICIDRSGRDIWHKKVGLYKGPVTCYFYKNLIFTITTKGNTYIFDRLGNLLWEQNLNLFVNRSVLTPEGFFAGSLKNSKMLFVMDKDGSEMFVKEFQQNISALDISKDGKFVLVGTIQGDVFLFNSEGSCVFSYMLSNRINCVSISDNEKYFAVGTNDFFAYLFNTRGDLYWTYRTGMQGEDESFFQELPAGCAPIDKAHSPENIDEFGKEGARILDGLKKMINRLSKKPKAREIDEGPPKIIEEEKREELDEEFKEDPIESYEGPRDNSLQVEQKPKKKGVIIKTWANQKDVHSQMYLIMISNSTDFPLETVEIIPKLSSHSFKVIPGFKDFDTIPSNKKLLVKFKLEPVKNYNHFEDTQIFSEINYIDPTSSKMVSINTNKVLIPFNIPQIQFKPDIPKDLDETDFQSIQAELEFQVTPQEVGEIFEEYLEEKHFHFTKLEGDEMGYELFGKDYRGKRWHILIKLFERGPISTGVSIDLRSQNPRSLPALYHFLRAKISKILTDDIHEYDPEEVEWLDEEQDVEWIAEDDSETLKELLEEDLPTTEPVDYQEGESVSVMNIENIIQKHLSGVKRLQSRGFYLLDYHDRSKVMDLINKNSQRVSRCIFLTREYPKKIKEMHEIDAELMDIKWISAIGEEGAYKPTDLDRMVGDIRRSLEVNEKAMVVIDSTEYLLNNNDYKEVYNFISQLKDLSSVSRSILLLNIDLNSLEERELNQLKKEADEVWEL